MALTITIEGKGVIANCDSETNDTGGTGTGDWSEEGGGTMSLTNDVYLYGDSSIAGKYASKSGLQQFDLGSGNELDFDTGGNEEGQFIYMWINLATFGVLETLANKGLAIRISSSSPGTSNYKDYLIAGSDGSNGWTGGWKLFVIDPTKTASFTNGTCDIGSIRTLGVWIDTAASVRAESLFIDQIAVGTGLRITGTSTTAIKDVVDYCTDYTNRAWGMLQERDGIYYAFGKLYIGDSTNQSADVSFADSGRIIQFGTSQYYESGAWKTTFPVDASGIIIEDHSSYKTEFTDGVIVGTQNGRSGSVIIGNSDQNIVMDLYGGNNAASATLCYGTTFKSLKGAFNSGNDTGHKFLGCSFVKCSQFDPVGAPVIRNCTFAETVDVDAALLWNANIDIQLCAFIANTLGAGIEHPAQGTFGYTDLLFSGNTYDMLYSAAASSGVLTINATDSNPSTSEITNPTGNSVSIVNSVNIDIYVKDTANNAIEGASVAVYKSSDDTELMNELTAVTTGLATQSFNYTGSTDVYIRVRKSSTGTRYIPVLTTGTIGSSGLTLTVVLNEDGIAS